MYRICPKCGYESIPDDKQSTDFCPACGVIYKKWLRQRLKDARPVPPTHQPEKSQRFEGLKNQLLTPKNDNLMLWGGRFIVWLMLLWLGIEMLGSDYSDAVMGTRSGAVNFIHGVNLIFHEAGHVIFRPLGDFMTILGGSLLQILIPFIIAAAFLIKHQDSYGASVGLWWTGQNLSDVSIYIRDAREMQLTLLGGGTGMDRPGFHDWHNLLSRLGWLEYERSLAAITNLFGVLLMALALVWGLVLLFRQWQYHDVH